MRLGIVLGGAGAVMLAGAGLIFGADESIPADLAAKLENSGGSDQEIARAIHEWAWKATVPLEEVRRALPLVQDPERKQGIGETALQNFLWHQDGSIEEAGTWIRANFGGEARDHLLLRSVALTLQHGDLESTAAFVPEMAPGNTKNAALLFVGRTFGETDHEAGFEWAAEIPDASERLEAMGGIGMGLGLQDPKRAIEVFESLPDSDGKRRFLRSVLAQWVAQEPVAGLAWISAREAPAQEKFENLLSGYSAWSGRDAESAVKHFREHHVYRGNGRIIETLTSRLGTVDPAKLLQWLSELPEEAFGDRKIRNAASLRFRKWVSKDQAAATTWAKSLAEEAVTLRQITAKWIIDAEGKQDPAAAYDKVAKLTVLVDRYYYGLRLAKLHASHEGKEAAIQLVNDSKLSPDDKAWVIENMGEE